MTQKRLHRLCLAGLFTAIVFVFTACLHIPSNTGYTHVGDAFIFLAASLMPTPYAVFVGAAGAALADCLTGYALWAPASLVIKAVTALFFTAKKPRILTTRNLLALIPSGVLCFGGYYGYEVLITGNTISPLAGLPGYFTQIVLSSALFLFLGVTLDKMSVKSRLMNGGNDQ